MSNFDPGLTSTGPGIDPNLVLYLTRATIFQKEPEPIPGLNQYFLVFDFELKKLQLFCSSTAVLYLYLIYFCSRFGSLRPSS